MATPDMEALGRLDGRDPNNPNYVAQPFTGVSLYKELPLGKENVTRPAGADSGKKPGEQWWTTSKIDQITVLAEVMCGRYNGQTAWKMLTGLFAVLVEGKDPAVVRAALGVSEPEEN